MVVVVGIAESCGDFMDMLRQPLPLVLTRFSLYDK